MENFTFVLRILSEMDGPLLHELYLMCLSNREAMFHTLKNELTGLNSTIEPLTLLVYVRFLHEISKCVPSIDHVSK